MAAQARRVDGAESCTRIDLFLHAWRPPSGFTSPKSLDRVLEFLFYLWCRDTRWVFSGPKLIKTPAGTRFWS